MEGAFSRRPRTEARGASADEPLRLTPVVGLCWAVLVIVMIVQIAPLIVVIPTAFSETTQIRFPPVGFSWKWFAEVLTSPEWIASFLKSVRVGAMVAVLSTFLGLALARGGLRFRSLFMKGLIQAVAIAPLVVPVIMLAIAVFDVQARSGLIDSDTGLVLAHAMLCIPLTFLILANALSFVDMSMEQAAWTMGASRVRAFWGIVFPTMVPAVVGSMVISFVTSWDETVVSMFQTQLNKTLPVTIYSLMRSGITPAVSAVSAMVIVPVLIGAIIYIVRSIRQKPGN